MSNFKFLDKRWPDLANLGYQGEAYFHTDSNASMVKMRMFGEKLIDYILASFNIEVDKFATQDDKIKLLRTTNINKSIPDLFDTVRRYGNKASHEGYSNKNDALECLVSIYKIATWYYLKVTKDDSIKPLVFNVSNIASSDLAINNIDKNKKLEQEEINAIKDKVNNKSKKKDTSSTKKGTQKSNTKNKTKDKVNTNSKKDTNTTDKLDDTADNNLNSNNKVNQKKSVQKKVKENKKTTSTSIQEASSINENKEDTSTKENNKDEKVSNEKKDISNDINLIVPSKKESTKNTITDDIKDESFSKNQKDSIDNIENNVSDNKNDICVEKETETNNKIDNKTEDKPENNNAIDDKPSIIDEGNAEEETENEIASDNKNKFVIHYDIKDIINKLVQHIKETTSRSGIKIKSIVENNKFQKINTKKLKKNIKKFIKKIKSFILKNYNKIKSLSFIKKFSSNRKKNLCILSALLIIASSILGIIFICNNKKDQASKNPIVNNDTTLSENEDSDNNDENKAEENQDVNSNNNDENRTEENINIIPESEKTEIPTITDAKYESLKSSINSIASNNFNKSSIKFSLAFKDISREDTFSINNKKVMAAGTIKIYIMMEAFNEVHRGTLNLEDVITLSDDMKTEGAGILLDRNSGEQFTIKDLIDLMMIKNDNTATNILINKIGINKINDFIKSLGCVDTELNRTMMDKAAINRGIHNYTSVNDLSLALSKLYNNKCVSKEYDTLMLDILKNNKYDEKIPKLIPTTASVLNKSGEYPLIENDAAIIVTDKGAYVLCITTSNSSNKKEIQSIRNASKEIYDAYIK